MDTKTNAAAEQPKRAAVDTDKTSKERGADDLAIPDYVMWDFGLPEKEDHGIRTYTTRPAS